MGWPKGVPRPKKAKVVTEMPMPGNGDSVVENAVALSGFDMDAFAKALAKGVVDGMKASKVEENRERDERQLAHRLRMRKQLQEDREAQFQRWKNCSHMRSHPYSGTSRIAWATQSDGVTRGTCMHCACPFSPIASELPYPEMVEWYKRMIAVPMTAAQNDFVTGMVAAGNPA